MVVHSCNPNIQEANKNKQTKNNIQETEAGESQVEG
jgi:hypothetical protein